MKPYNPQGHRKIAEWRQTERAKADLNREKSRLARQLILPMPGIPQQAICDQCFGRGCDHCEGQGIAEAKTKTCPRCYGTGYLANSKMEVYPCSRCKGKGIVPE